MYVVMTTAELFQYAGRFGDSGIEENLGWDAQDLETESTGISQSELAAFEICVPEYRARRMGILAPRGEYWISRTVERDAVGERMPIPWAMCPDRPLPSKGEPVQLQLVPSPVDQDDLSCGHIDTDVCCSPQWVSNEDYEGEGGPFSHKKKTIINAPPDDGNCMICGRHVRELEAFGGAGDPLVGDFSGAKLVKQFRKELPGYGHTKSSWECRDCVARSGPLWAIHEEDRLGRPLTEREYIDMQDKLERSLWEIHQKTNQSHSKHGVSP